MATKIAAGFTINYFVHLVLTFVVKVVGSTSSFILHFQMSCRCLGQIFINSPIVVNLSHQYSIVQNQCSTIIAAILRFAAQSSFKW